MSQEVIRKVVISLISLVAIVGFGCAGVEIYKGISNSSDSTARKSLINTITFAEENFFKVMGKYSGSFSEIGYSVPPEGYMLAFSTKCFPEAKDFAVVPAKYNEAERINFLKKIQALPCRDKGYSVYLFAMNNPEFRDLYKNQIIKNRS